MSRSRLFHTDENDRKRRTTNNWRDNNNNNNNNNDDNVSFENSDLSRASLADEIKTKIQNKRDELMKLDVELEALKSSVNNNQLFATNYYEFRVMEREKVAQEISRLEIHLTNLNKLIEQDHREYFDTLSCCIS